MFDQLFTRQASIAHHKSSPFTAERQLYLKHLVEEGRSRKTVRNIAQLLVVVVQHLRLDRPEITLAEIEAAAVELGWDCAPLSQMSPRWRAAVCLSRDRLASPAWKVARVTAGSCLRRAARGLS
jgi:hypothetical protein